MAMVHSVRTHWPEYLSEATGLGLFMVAAGVCATLLEHPASPAHEALPSAFLRRALMGVVGLVIAGFITFAAPLSGTSLNPARTVASALPSGTWTAVWVYFAAPALGALAAAQVYLRLRGESVHCAKLLHCTGGHCVFCDCLTARPAAAPD
jgi:glycerol uptake facilitator-like aquaporin